ncbi:hypothetical protein XENOCAPTIV_018000 [Xenoophorus captivus]|uniref:Pericentriolar material 1 protein C-terminal domain-containing protein n=1 Tax=Xenoophorus captivus TaxID=1517983 RepID=A0ABV0QKJ9_9TELE
MNEVCSHQLLTSVRRMVLTLSQQHDESKEFVRFFHKQLGGILQANAEACAVKSVSPAFADEDKDHDETEKKGSAALQENYLQTEVNNSAETLDFSVEERTPVEHQNPEEEREVGASAAEGSSETSQDVPNESSTSTSPDTVSPVLVSVDKRIVEEQQNNNLSVEILNGNAELLTGLVGSAQALKEPDHSSSFSETTDGQNM